VEIIEVDANINDLEFSEKSARIMDDLMKKNY